MDKISELLQYVRRTNPEMTRERLIEELSKSDYVARSINFTKENFSDRHHKSIFFWYPPTLPFFSRNMKIENFGFRATNVQLSRLVWIAWQFVILNRYDLNR